MADRLCMQFFSTSKGLLSCLSLQNISWIFSQNCISHHGCGNVLNLWCWHEWKIHLWVKKEITQFTRTAFFWKSIFHPAESGRIMELKRWPKLNLQGYWWQVLTNSTIFATFAFLEFVSLCHNLNSSMLKCEGSLT